MYFLRETFPSYLSSLIFLKILCWVIGLVNFLSGIFESWRINSEMMSTYSYFSHYFPLPPINAYHPHLICPFIQTLHYWHSVKSSTPAFVNGGYPCQHGQRPKLTSLPLLCSISRNTWRMKLIFCLQINKGFFKLILSFLVRLARHAQITQNNEFAIS